MSPQPLRGGRRLAAAAAVLALVALASSAALAGVNRPRLAVDSNDWAPYFLAEGKQPGFAREVMEACLPAMGYELRFWPLPIGETLSALRSGKLDAHVLSKEPDREAYLVYGKVPLFTDGYRPVVRAGSGIRITSLADFDRLRLGHVKGLRYSPEFYDYVYRRIAAGTVVQGETSEELQSLLLADKIDVFVGQEGTNRWVLRQRGNASRLEILPFDIKRSDYFLAASRRSSRIPDEQAFVDAFDACLRRLAASGSLAALRTRYGLE